MLERATRGEDSESIARWLREDKGIDVAARCVRERIQAVRRERSDLTREAVREKLAEGALADVLRFDRIRRQIAERARDPEIELREWVALKRLELAAITQKLRFAGADPADAGDVGKMSNDELRELARRAVQLFHETEDE